MCAADTESVPEEEAEIGDIDVCWDRIQVARGECEEVVEDKRVFGLVPDRYLQRERRRSEAVDEAEEDVVAARGLVGQLCPARIADFQGVRTGL